MTFGLLQMLWDWPAWIIVIVLLGLMLAANELGFRSGRRDQWFETELSRSVANTFKGSVFGLAALLLGFSFSATATRYDLRQRIVLDQANAIGTCHLRAGLLSDAPCRRIRSTLEDYLNARLKQYHERRNEAEFRREQVKIDRCLATLWAVVEEANRREPERVRDSQIVPAAGDVIDLSSTRTWANQNHLAQPVLLLLMASVLVTCLLLGHSSGQSGQRHRSLWLAANLIFAMVLYIVLEFDTPGRGLIQVDQSPLIELNRSLDQTPTP